MAIFKVLLANKLDDDISLSYIGVVSPLFISYCTLILMSFGAKGGNRWWFGIHSLHKSNFLSEGLFDTIYMRRVWCNVVIDILWCIPRLIPLERWIQCVTTRVSDSVCDVLNHSSCARRVSRQSAIHSRPFLTRVCYCSSSQLLHTPNYPSSIMSGSFRPYQFEPILSHHKNCTSRPPNPLLLKKTGEGEPLTVVKICVHALLQYVLGSRVGSALLFIARTWPFYKRSTLAQVDTGPYLEPGLMMVSFIHKYEVGKYQHQKLAEATIKVRLGCIAQVTSGRSVSKRLALIRDPTPVPQPLTPSQCRKKKKLKRVDENRWLPFRA
uniref:Uncharacterized protein n=1 Tax=Timema genevievae TaxID=629358 RepID=A0A7R9JQY4_TIMGE|nr:unnamed protein product [Timema genevievae]